jgi:uncharacterized protein
MLVTNEWAEFLALTGANVGISIDGPAWIHDGARKGRKGEPTHSRVMHGARLLWDAGIAPGALCVLTAESIKHPDSIFWFFEHSRFRSISFNFEEIIGCNENNGFDAAAPQLAEEFIYRYIRLIQENESAQSIREIEQPAARLFAPDLSGLLASVCEPFGHISIDFLGNYWTFSPDLGHGPGGGGYYLGNCRNDPLDIAANTDTFGDISRAVDRGVAICKRDCAYFAMCGGGSPAHKLLAKGHFEVGETLFCQLAVKAPINALTKIFSDEEAVAQTRG